MTTTPPTAAELRALADAYHAAAADAELEPTWTSLRSQATQGAYSSEVDLSGTAGARLIELDLGLAVRDLGAMDGGRKYSVAWN